MATMRALLLTDDPPTDGLPIFGDVYQVPVDEGLRGYPLRDETLRFFVGYAGWSPGQLERELRFGSWDVVPASESAVFAAEPEGLWRQVRPTPQFRAGVGHDVSVR